MFSKCVRKFDDNFMTHNSNKCKIMTEVIFAIGKTSLFGDIRSSIHSNAADKVDCNSARTTVTR